MTPPASIDLDEPTNTQETQMSEVLDLDALPGDDDNREPFRFRFGGDDYEFPAALDFRVAIALEAGEIGEALHRLLGDEQWARMSDSEATLDAAKFTALMTAYREHTTPPVVPAKPAPKPRATQVR